MNKVNEVTDSPAPQAVGVTANTQAGAPDTLLSAHETASYGQKAVGFTFNPSGNYTVQEIKGLYANVIDILNNFRNASDSPEVKRLASIAITEAQGALLWADKAVTWVD